MQAIIKVYSFIGKHIHHLPYQQYQMNGNSSANTSTFVLQNLFLGNKKRIFQTFHNTEMTWSVQLFPCASLFKLHIQCCWSLTNTRSQGISSHDIGHHWGNGMDEKLHPAINCVSDYLSLSYSPMPKLIIAASCWLYFFHNSHNRVNYQSNATEYVNLYHISVN